MKHIYFGVFFLVSFPLIILTRAGDLDPTFGFGNGFITTAIGGGFNSGNGIARQQDGKYVVAGFADNGATVVRYNADGSLDITFANNGIAIETYGGTNSRNNGVVIQPDGKIVVAGQTNTGIDNFLVARYSTDGTLDSSFGTGGFTITNFGIFSSATSIVLQNDGKIVACGTTFDAMANFALARYNPDGSEDTSFGTNGMIITEFNAQNSTIISATIQPCDGKIIAAGYAESGGIIVFAIARYNTDGSLDNSFGPLNDGKNTTDFGSPTNQGFSVALQSDGKIVMCGVTDLAAGYNYFTGTFQIGEGFNIALVRYTTSGIEDPTFGPNGNGKVLTPGMNGGISVDVQPDDKLFIAALNINDLNQLFLRPTRYTKDGFLDQTFGVNGQYQTNIEVFQGETTPFTQAIMQPDGRFVISGTSTNNDGDILVARFLNDTLTITKKASTQNPCPGQNITYTITATNFGSGGGVVNGIFVADVLPQELIFQSAKTSGAQSSFDPITSVWSIPRLCIGESARLKINARVQQFAGEQTLCNTAITTYSSIDNVTNSSLFESLSIFDTEIFSTTECVSTLPVVFENINHKAQRADCGLFQVDQELCDIKGIIGIINKQQDLNNTVINTLLLKLDCILGF